MFKPMKRVVVTGGSGQVAYNLLFRVASGEMLGADQPIALHILDIPSALESLSGVVMELQDCAYPLLQEIKTGSDPKELFKDVDYALLVGSRPRGPGMERGDLLKANGQIFVEQGKGLNEVANKDVKVIVVGNPCNTNCLIAMHHAPRIPRKNFYALTCLDQNRAKAQLAMKAGVPVKEVSNMTIWGNHSATQVPDFVNARIKNWPVTDFIKESSWLKNEFMPIVQKRGAQVIAARGKSSAASAANATIDLVKSIVNPTKEGDWFSSGVCSDGNLYGIQEDLIFSFPCFSRGEGECHIVADVPWDDFLKEKIALTEQDLIKEKEIVKDLL